MLMIDFLISNISEIFYTNIIIILSTRILLFLDEKLHFLNQILLDIFLLLYATSFFLTPVILIVWVWTV